jgi:predicted nucleotidyltransferase
MAATMDVRLRTLDPKSRVETLTRLKHDLASRPEVVFAYLYGSFAEGLPFRDIDVAIWLEPGMASLDRELELGVELQRVVPIRVDVQLLNMAPLALRYHATRGLLLVSKDDNIRSECVERWRSAYWDYLPVARHHLAEVLHG